MAAPTLLTVILNWRSPDMTLTAAETTLREMVGIDGALTIVDNDSGDGSFETMSQVVAARGWDCGPHRVRVLQSGRNGGFGAGNNFGIRAGLPDGGRPDYVYILNSDAFPDAGAIHALLRHMITTPTTGFAGSFLHGQDGMPHGTAFRFPSIASEFEGAARFGPVSRLLCRHAVPLPMPQATGPVDWLAGASLMMRQSVLDRIGLFDETFFLYFEETDLCRRARLAGWPTVYVTESSVTHIGSVSTGMKNWARMPGYWFDSRLHYFRKNHGRGGAILATLAHLGGGLIWRARCLLQGRDPIDPPHFLRDLARHHVGAALAPPRTAPLTAPGDRPAPATGD